MNDIRHSDQGAGVDLLQFLARFTVWIIVACTLVVAAACAIKGAMWAVGLLW